MPLDFNKLADFDLTNFGAGVLPNITGAVELVPNNYVPDQFFRALQSDGAPSGWSKVEGPTNDGYFPYLFKIDGNVRVGGKQTATPDGAEQDTHLFNTPLLSGGPAPSAGTPGVATPAQPLEAPVVTKVATGISGFPQGEYLAAISLERNGTHTLLTNTQQVTINTDGKLLEFKLLLDADRTLVTGQGLWLSAPVALGGTPDPATLRLQDVAPNQGRTFVLKGPYNYAGRLAPTVNETAIGTPPKLERPIDAAPEGGQAQSIRVGRYVFYIVQCTESGDSLPSPGEPPPPAYMTFRTVAPHTGFVFHPRLMPQATGYKIFHQDFNESSNPGFYQLVRTRAGDKARPFTPDEKPVFFGKIDTGEVTTQVPGTYLGSQVTFSASSITDFLTTATSAGFNNGIEVRVSGGGLPAPLRANKSYWVVNKSGTAFKLAATKGGNAINLTSTGTGKVFTYKVISPPGSFSYISVSGDPPTEDTSGIADPTGEIDAPVPVGLGVPEAGTYLVGYTRRLGGQETPLSDTVTVTLSSGEVATGTVLQMEYPPRVNKIANSLYGQIDQKNLPLHWTVMNSSNSAVTVADANHNFSAAGKFFVQTSGSLANTGRYPNLITKAGKQIAVDPSRIETLAGWLEVSGWVSGQGYAELVQLDASLAEVGTRLTLATLAANGAVYFEKTLASASLGADLALHASCAFIKVQWGTEGNPRQLHVVVHSLIWAPQRGISRRYITPASPSDYWEASTDPAAPWPSTHVLAMGQPPPTAASAAGNAVAPTVSGQIELLNYDALADGADPSGWTAVESGGATAGAFTNTVWGNAKTYRVTSSDTASDSKAYIYKDYADWSGTTAVFVMRERMTSIGNVYGTYYFAVTPKSTAPNDNAKTGVWIFNTQTGPVSYGHGYNYPNGASGSSEQIPYPALIEMKIELTGLGTTNGTVAYYYRVKGTASWTPGDSRSSVDLSDMGPGGLGFRVAMGVFQEGSNSLQWTIDFGQLYVGTDEPAEIVNTAPALTPLVQPDWPWLAGTILNGPSSSPVDYTYTTSNNATLGVAATFNRASGVAAERTLAQIRTSGGTEIVGLYMKTDHTVELRKGASVFPVSTAVPTGTNYRFDVIVAGAGGTSSAGVALVYRTIGAGARELIVLGTNLDFSTTQAQRATVANNTELTETSIVVTSAGEYTYDNTGPDNAAINQGYVAIIPADVTNTDIGFVVDEYVVKPGQERTFAVFMRPDDLNDDAAPFTLVAYDAAGTSVELGSVYADGTAVANASPGWYEYWMAYTAPEGYYRMRVENRDHTEGRYVFQKPLDALGNLNTTALRAAARDGRRATSGVYTAVLNSRIPQQSGTILNNAFQETRTALGYSAITPTGTVKAFSVDATTDVFTAANHRYQSGASVRVSGLTNGAPLAIDTTYYVRDVTTNTFKLALSSGGTAINITSTGSGSVFGYSFVTARYYSTDNPDVVSTWQTEGNELLVPDLEWVFAELTLQGDGLDTPSVPVGNPYVAYTTNMPMLLRGDRTPLPGGVYLGGGGSNRNLRRPFKRSMFDEDAIGDRAGPRAITAEIGRLHGYTANVVHIDSLDLIQSDVFLEEDWIIESPFHDMILLVRHYGPPGEPEAMVDYEWLDERQPFAISTMPPQVFAIERAEVISMATLSGNLDSDLQP